MPFVQLVIEKEEEGPDFQTWIKSSKSQKKRAYPLLAQVAVDESDKEKTVRFFQDSVSPLMQSLFKFTVLQSQANRFMK